MDQTTYNRELFSYLQDSPTAFHAAHNGAYYLVKHGFEELLEHKKWQLENGHSYFLTRDDGALLAFTLGSAETIADGFRLLGAHTDSPSLQIKPNPALKTLSFFQLGVEVYGGPLLAPWFDRDLSLAGRVCCETRSGEIKMLLIDFRRPLLFLPSVAIHFDREANKNRSINQQKDLPPVLGLAAGDQPLNFSALLADQLKEQYPQIPLHEILSFDIFCYDSQAPASTGMNGECISASRLDNLLSCHAGLTAMAAADKRKNTMLLCANHEENGSTSASGAQGSILDAVFDRIYPTSAEMRVGLASSFLISMDNAHGSHPNCMEKMENNHPVHLNCGPVIKINSNMRYATSSLSAAVYKKICRVAEVTPQEFVMRSDQPCGSTIGPMTAARLGIAALDVGAPTLAMHSIREHTGSADPFLLYRTIETFLNSDIHKEHLRR